jgi:thioester reductase-like protein
MQQRNAIASLADLLSLRAESLPGQRYTFLDFTAGAEAHLSYAELEARATALAVGLRSRAKPGDRILVLVPLGLDYTVAILACAVAGLIAVPAYPPDAGAAASTLSPIVAVIEDCSPVLALVGRAVAETLRQIPDLPRSIVSLPVLPLDEVEVLSRGEKRDWSVDADAAAVMLYTSGSTGTPKGVVLSHGNFLHASRVTAQDWRLDETMTSCAWVPGYHISGLFSGIVLPLWAGAHSVGFAPRAFVERPVRWLETIDRFGAYSSGAPTFAYDMLARSVTPAESAKLDLSRWSVAVIGGEAVRRDVLEAFSRRFAGNGFRRSSFYTMFGLTEAVMISTGSGYQTGPAEDWVDRDTLKQGMAVAVEPGHPSGVASIASGSALPETEMLVVDPVTLQPQPERRVGEIWIGGRAVGEGYWGREQLTADVFCARTDNGAGPYLRSGDLAYLAHGQLHIVGRMKEMIIIRGLNFYPEDLEASIRRAVPRLQAARLAAFAIQLDGEEQLAVALEQKGAEDPALTGAIRRAVTADHGIQVGAVVVLPEGAIPMTATGKVQRGRCAQLVAEKRADASPRAHKAAAEIRLDKAAFAALPAGERRAEAARVLRQIIAGLSKLPEDQIAADAPLPAFGIDSILTVKLGLQISDFFGVAVPTAMLRDVATVHDLAEFIATGEGFDVPHVTDLVLPAEITPPPAMSMSEPGAIFLTGGTGFLGSFLLAELLRSTQAKIFCLTRADNPAAGLRRLADKLRAIGAWKDDYVRRLEPVNGDLARPHLGIDAATFDRIAREAHCIYHNGASVDFVAPYGLLEKSNVGAVLECLRLATTQRAKSVHFTSTLAVFNAAERMRFERIGENDRLSGPEKIVSGYAQTKWVAESLLTQAGVRGVPVGIYRAGFIGGHTATGFWNTEDFICRMIKGSIQLGLYPDIELDLPFVPVDHVARSIVSLSKELTRGANAFHVLAGSLLSFKGLMEAAADLGHALRPIPYLRWRRLLREALPMSNDLYPVLPFLIEAGAAGETVIDIFLKPDQPVWDDGATRTALAGIGIGTPRVDRAYVQRCLKFFHYVGFLDHPASAA